MQPWSEPALSDICTRNLIYFDPEHEAVCRRICKVIGIDLFPDSEGQHCWYLKEESWEQIRTTENQFAKASVGCFDPVVLDKMDQSRSNLLFLGERGYLEGIVHFTDYVKMPVYESLFCNLFQFEKGLRSYLTRKKFNYSHLKAYFEYKIEKERRKKKKGSKALKEYEDKLKKMREDKFEKNASQYGNLQLSYLYDLMKFGISGYHEKPLHDLAFIKANQSYQKINDLRNIIMHAKDVTIWDHGVPHKFSQFKEFFGQVEALKSAFFQLDDLLSGNEETNNEETSNKDLLTKLKKLSDEDLRSKFMHHD